MTCPKCKTQVIFDLYYEFDYVCYNCGFEFYNLRLKENNNGREREDN